MKTHIYAIVDPLTRSIRYVGKANNVRKRLVNHLKGNKRNTKKLRWFSSLKDSGYMPEIEIIETCDLSEWEERERFWIAELKKLGFDLLNGNSGGSGATEITEATREAIKAAMKRPEVLKKIAESNSDPIVISQRSASLKKAATPVLRSRLSEAFSKRHKDPKWAEHMRNKTGKPVVQISDDGSVIARYQTMSIASRESGIAKSEISKSVRGMAASCRGTRWEIV